jgi:hypothetical protein
MVEAPAPTTRAKRVTEQPMRREALEVEARWAGDPAVVDALREKAAGEQLRREALEELTRRAAAAEEEARRQAGEERARRAAAEAAAQPQEPARAAQRDRWPARPAWSRRGTRRVLVRRDGADELRRHVAACRTAAQEARLRADEAIARLEALADALERQLVSES